MACTDPDCAGLAESEHIVGLAIAVVVEVVAEFGGWRQRHSRAVELSVHAPTLHESLGLACSDSDRAGFADPREVVDVAIAVVVEVVAELRAGQDLVQAGGPVVILVTELGASLTEADGLSPCGPSVTVLAAARLAVTVEAVVVDAVAVVVSAIADFVTGDAGDTVAAVAAR